MLKFKLKYGSGDTIIQPRQTELSFLYATPRVDLFYNPTMYHYNVFLMVAELCSRNENEVKKWTREPNYKKISRVYATPRVDLYNPTKNL